MIYIYVCIYIYIIVCSLVYRYRTLLALSRYSTRLPVSPALHRLLARACYNTLALHAAYQRHTDTDPDTDTDTLKPRIYYLLSINYCLHEQRTPAAANLASFSHSSILCEASSTSPLSPRQAVWSNLLLWSSRWCMGPPAATSWGR